MKLSLEWLNAYLDRPVDRSELEHRLTRQGFPLETIDPVGEDLMLDAEVTSNRGDTLSHLGMAREVAAGSNRSLIPPDDLPPPEDSAQNVSELTGVTMQAPEACPLYTARVIRGVKVGPSPDWLVRRLNTIGLRSVSNVVDVTNYVLMELGQPLHTFDMAQLADRRIVVRYAQGQEPFQAIDQTQHRLAPSMLVIADADRPQAVGGVMGGLGSEVSERTTDLLLEAALFDPLSVRRTSRALKLQSDSSYRYERGVDPMGVDRASLRAARLILELAGGSLAQGVIRVGPLAEQPPEPHVVRLRPQRCRSLLGIDVPTPAMLAYLDALGLKPKAEENEAGITCTIPSFRLDLTREVDLIEEVARLHGLEKIEVRSKVQIRARPKQPAVAAREAMGHALVGLGFHETITDSLMSPRVAEPFVAEGCAPMVLDESLSWGANTLRPSLLPSLLACRKRNEDRGNQGLRLFEAATTWSRDPQGEPREEERLGLLVEGQEAQECLRDLRGAIEETLERLVGDEPVRFVVAQNEPHLSPAAQIHLDGQPIGRLGLAKLEAPEAVLKEDFGLHGPGAPSVAVAELALRGLLREDYPPERQVGELPKFPSIERDLSVILDEAVTWEQVEASLRASQPELLESLAYVTTYRGKPLSKGQKSLTLRLRFRHPDKTLRREEVDPQVEAVVRKLRDDLNAELRTA